MAWLLGLPLLPLIFCGVMCLVPALLVMLGLRRRDATSAPGEKQEGPGSRVGDKS